MFREEFGFPMKEKLGERLVYFDSQVQEKLKARARSLGQAAIRQETSPSDKKEAINVSHLKDEWSRIQWLAQAYWYTGRSKVVYDLSGIPKLTSLDGEKCVAIPNWTEYEPYKTYAAERTLRIAASRRNQA